MPSYYGIYEQSNGCTIIAMVAASPASGSYLDVLNLKSLLSFWRIKRPLSPNLLTLIVDVVLLVEFMA